jgi:hypothetical protein
MFTPWDVKLSHRGLLDYLIGVAIVYPVRLVP